MHARMPVLPRLCFASSHASSPTCAAPLALLCCVARSRADDERHPPRPPRTHFCISIAAAPQYMENGHQVQCNATNRVGALLDPIPAAVRSCSCLYPRSVCTQHPILDARVAPRARRAARPPGRCTRAAWSPARPRSPVSASAPRSSRTPSAPPCSSAAPLQTAPHTTTPSASPHSRRECEPRCNSAARNAPLALCGAGAARRAERGGPGARCT